MKKLLTILPLFILWSFTGYTQTYPVSATTQLTPPYSVYLADYVAPGSDRLALNLFLGDVNRPELQVKLRLRIEGQGIIIETKPEYLPPPLILQGGIPERLIASDLAGYFRPENLNFQGITRQQFERTGALPEGLYRFCFEVLEYNRGVKISNTSCAMAWMILNDPPIINLPKQNEKIRPQDPQFITFQWTPRHTGSPNSAFRTEYEFSMVELWPDTRNPNDAILTIPPIHQVATQSTTLIYGPAETPLVPGRRYAFRVRAKSIVGVDELDLFKNSGYSETFTFTYGDACTLPTNIGAEAINAAKFKVKWQPMYNHSGFSVRYKLANDPNAQWYEEDTFFDEIDIEDLQPETTYEYQVSGSCGTFTSAFSAIGKATTAAMPEVDYNCGLPPLDYDMQNTTPIEDLKVGDVINAGDFEVKVVKLTPSGNRYNGKGTVLVPYLDNLIVSVDFANIEVNTDYRLFRGYMNVIGIGIDIIPDELSTLLDKLDEGLAQLDDLLGEISAGLDIAGEILDAVGDLANDIMDNGPFTTEEETALDGLTVSEYNVKAKEALADATGAMANAKISENYDVVARKVAQAITLKKRASKLNKIYNSADTLQVIAVEFYENLHYGFDAQKYPQHRLHYNIMITDSTDATTNTPVPWAAAKVGEAITVKAKLIPNQGVAAGDVTFKADQPDGDELTARLSGDTWEVTLPQLTEGQILDVLAVNAQNETVGKLQAIGYAPIEKKVVLVPVNGITGTPGQQALTTYLNTVYKQAVAGWTIEIAPGIQIDSFDGTLQDDEQATLSTYSEGMKAIIRAYKNTTTIDEDAFYLFMVNQSSTGNAGYMPRKHRYGFIYMDKGGDHLQTIAHELGHGAFRLQHTFEEYPTIAETTQNLMDYGGGTTLRKYQWDLIHNPPLVIGLVEDLEEGAMISKDDSIKVNIVSFKSKFAPGFGNLEFNYELSDSTKAIVEKYKDEDFKVQFSVVSEGNDLIYSQLKDVEIEGSFLWDGYLDDDKTKPINIDDGPYNLVVRLSLGSSDLNDWQDWKDVTYEFVFDDSVRVTSFTTDTTFNIDPVALDYLEHKDKYEPLMTDSVKADYFKFVDDFKKDGYFNKESVQPLEWLEENGLTANEITFLGMNIRRVITPFKEVLEETEINLKNDYPEAYSEIISQYSGVISLKGQTAIRYIDNNCDCNPSNHSLGAAIDINFELNPQIISENKEYTALIKYITGLDLTKPKTVQEVVDAQETFMIKLNGQKTSKYSLAEIIEDYELVNKLNTEIIKLGDLVNKNIIIEGFESKKENLIEALEAHKYRLVFTPVSFQAIDSMVVYLKSITKDTIQQFEVYNWGDFRAEKASFLNETKGGTVTDLKSFIKYFGNTNGRLAFKNKLLQDGFGESRIELINSFQKAHRKIYQKYFNKAEDGEWGGTYTYKYDGMHFGLKTSFIKELTNK